MANLIDTTVFGDLTVTRRINNINITPPESEAVLTVAGDIGITGNGVLDIGSGGALGSGAFNPVFSHPSSISTMTALTGADVISQLTFTNGHVSAVSTRALTPADIGASPSTHTHTKSQVGLGSVDNTSDLSKPISTATQTALDGKAPISNPTFTGKIGVGTATPKSMLHLQENINGVGASIFLQNINGGVGTSSEITFSNVSPTNLTPLSQIQSQVMNSAYHSDLIFRNYPSGEVARMDSQGNLSVKRDLSIGGSFVMKNTEGLIIDDSSATSKGVGGSIQLGYKFNSAGDYLRIAKIKATKLNDIPGNYDTGLTFYTTPNSGMAYQTRAMDIIQNGNVGIGIITPTEKLEVNGNIKATTFKKTDGTEVSYNGHTHNASTITENTNKRFVSDSEKSTWNGKQDAIGYTPFDQAGGTVAGDITFNGADYHNYTSTWWNCNPGFDSPYGYGMYQWNNMFQFTKRNSNNEYINEAWHIELDTEKTVFNYPASFVSASFSNIPTVNGTNVALANDSLPASQVTESSTKRFVTDIEKASWSAKSNFSGNYNDLTNKPTITSGSGMNFTTGSGNVTITLGTPSDITASSNNSVTTNSHTHKITGFALSSHDHHEMFYRELPADTEGFRVKYNKSRKALQFVFEG